MAVATGEVSRLGIRIKKRQRPPGSARPASALWFILPAALFLGALVVYPLIDTIAQSFQDSTTRSFTGLQNYQDTFGNDRFLTALRNTLVWVAVAPAIITGVGLVYAVLTERVGYGTALKVILFMPMAISMLSIGVIWRVMYEADPARGLINAGVGVAANAINGPGPYPDATPANIRGERAQGGAIVRFADGQIAECWNLPAQVRAVAS